MSKRERKMHKCDDADVVVIAIVAAIITTIEEIITVKMHGVKK